MELNDATSALLKAEHVLRSKGVIDNPAKLSRIMSHMSNYAGAVEEKLAEYERDYELQQAQALRTFLIDEELSATAAEKQVKIKLGELKSQIVYLTRIVSSAWRQVGTIQSRINHLTKLSETTNL